MNNIGFQIKNRKRKIDSCIVASFKSLPVANVSDCMNRLFAGGSNIRPIHDSTEVIAGAALTVRTRPGDNLVLHHAIDIAEPGDIIVVDAGGDQTNAMMGEIMAALAIKKGVAGIIINGAIRDAAEIRRMGLPVFATGVSHRGPYKDGPGEINTPICIDGMVIEAGDLILADGDGVLSVSIDHAEAILAAAQAKYAAEQVEIAAIENGSVDRSWVVNALKARGCVFE